MSEGHPIKHFLLATREYWDRPDIPVHVRENFWKIINCGTIALGAEVFSSGTELKLVYHTCKSRFCSSCGQRATEAWQESLQATLPDIPYIAITLTMPKEFWPVLQQNRHLLHGMPTMGAEAVSLWAKSRFGIKVVVIVVQHTFGGFLNFYPHLHVLISAGGLQDSSQKWKWMATMRRYDQAHIDLMKIWRYAVIAYLADALKSHVLASEMTADEFTILLKTQHRRRWNIDISRRMSKSHFLKYVGRYIRRPPVAQHRLKRSSETEVEYVAKDTMNNCFVPVRYSNKEFMEILINQVPDKRRHGMRYFGILAPRTKAQTWTGLYLLLRQKQRPAPRRTKWRALLLKTFRYDPLIDSFGQELRWIGRLGPIRLPNALNLIFAKNLCFRQSAGRRARSTKC